ncbi:hypothetical protein BJY52DRAFT_1132160, partial [Lactarius psammicola]
LDHFIAYAPHHTRLHPSVTFAALYLLQRLKVRFPTMSSGHRLFISAFILKTICDNTYSCSVGSPSPPFHSPLPFPLLSPPL